MQETDSEQRDLAVPDRPRIRRRRAVTGVAASVASGLVLLPDLVRLDHWTPFAQAVAFRPVLVVALAITGAGLLFVRRPAVRWSAVAVLAAAVAAAVLIAPRAIADPTVKGAADTLTVATINVKGGNASVDAVASMIDQAAADVVALPEAGEDYRVRLEAALGESHTGVSLQVSDSAVSAVSVLYRTDLGQVTAEPSISGSFPMWELAGGALGSTRFVAFHAYPPLPLSTGTWRRDLASLESLCQSPDPVVVAGDFNATLDHSALRAATQGCTDAAAATGQGLQGTWPSSAPGPLRAAIDHVFTTEGLQADSVDFAEIDGTDHLAVVTSLMAG